MNNQTLWSSVLEGRLRMNYRQAINELISAGVADEDAEKAAYDALCQLHFKLMRERMKQGEEGRLE